MVEPIRSLLLSNLEDSDIHKESSYEWLVNGGEGGHRLHL